MENNIKINIDDLEDVIHILLSQLKKNKGNEIEISNDFYWDISTKELYNPYNTPNDLSLGQLSDEVNEIQKIKQNNIGLNYDLKRVSEVLKAISIEFPVLF